MSGPSFSASNPSAQSPENSLNQFFAAMQGSSNPFRSNRVSEPSERDVDVSSIHDGDFQRLVKWADEVRRQACDPVDRESLGTGVTLLGGPGIGKSHLLSRLFRWSRKENQAAYVYLHNLKASTERLPRYLLQSVISVLLRGKRKAYRETPLYEILRKAVIAASKQAGLSNRPTARQGREAFREFTSSMRAGWKFFEVFWKFFQSVNTSAKSQVEENLLADAAVDWLSGEIVDPELGERLGLKPDREGDYQLADDEEVEEVLIAVSELIAVTDRPFILCIDQCDTFDPEKIKEFSKFLHSLLDHTQNLLLIVSGVKQTLWNFQEDGTIPVSTWDRLAERKLTLQRISPAQGREIIEARLHRFLEPFRELPEVARALEKNDYFPIGEKWYEQKTDGALELRPRDVLTWSRDAWEDEQFRLEKLGPEAWLSNWPGEEDEVAPPEIDIEEGSLEEAIDAKVKAKMEELVSQRRLHAGSLPPDADNLTTLVESLLKRCLNGAGEYGVKKVERVKPARKNQKPPFDLAVHRSSENGSGEFRHGLTFITAKGGVKTTAALKRLLNVKHPPDCRLLVTDEERRPLRLGAVGKEVYRDLQRLGKGEFRHVKLDFEQYARLDALEGVIHLARSGDLEVNYPRGTIRPVREDEVVESLQRQELLTEHPILGELLANADTEEKPPVENVTLNKEDVKQTIMAHLSLNLGFTTTELTEHYLKMNADLRIDFEEAKRQLKNYASEMYEDELVYATPQDDDLFLQLKKTSPPS